MKKITKALLTFLLIGTLGGCGKKSESKSLPKATPDPESVFGVDKNINIDTIDNWLGREDSVYMDVRMLNDPARFCNIDEKGNPILTGFVDGFEVVPYPYLATVVGLPPETLYKYEGPSLYTITEEGEYVANYKESLLIIEDLFPRDKNIFLMCGGGGYASMTKSLLVALGYNPDKIYNVGGYWYYKGDNKVKVEVTYGDGLDSYYAWHRIKYHMIAFDDYSPIG